MARLMNTPDELRHLDCWLQVACNDMNCLEEVQAAFRREHSRMIVSPGLFKLWLWVSQDIAVNKFTDRGDFIRPVHMSRED